MNTEKVVYLNDENGQMQDKFKAKANSQAPGVGENNPFVVSDMAYSPDSSRIALGQSDCIVYVYKLGLDWKDKKSISNKFLTKVQQLTSKTNGLASVLLPIPVPDRGFGVGVGQLFLSPGAAGAGLSGNSGMEARQRQRAHLWPH